MDKELLYQQYLSNAQLDTPLSFEEFTSLESIMAPEDFQSFIGLKKKEDTNQVEQISTPTEDVNTPTLNQEENLNVSVPLSNDLDLNQEQQQLIQPTQSNGVSSSELQLPLETTTTASDLVGVNQDSLSASQEPKPTQKLKDFKTYQSELSNLKNQFTKYESELKKNPLLIEQDKIELNIKNLNSQIKSIEEDETFKQKNFTEKDLINRINDLSKNAVNGQLPPTEFNLYQNFKNQLDKLNVDADYKNKSNKLNELYALRNSDATKYNEINDNTEVKDLLSKYKTSLESYNNIINSNDYKKSFEDYKKNNISSVDKITEKKQIFSSKIQDKLYPKKPKKALPPEISTFDTSGFTPIPIPLDYKITNENGDVVAEIQDDVKEAFVNDYNQTILKTDKGIIPLEVYLSLKDKEGNQRKPNSKDVWENINGFVVQQEEYSVPVDETIKTFQGYDYISSKDEYGNILSDQPINVSVYKELEQRGLGKVEYHSDGIPKFKIEKDRVKELDNALLSDINEAINFRNRLRNNRYRDEVYKGAEIERLGREEAERKWGKELVSQYGVLPDSAMQKIVDERSVERYIINQGYTEEQARQVVQQNNANNLKLINDNNNYILSEINKELKAEDAQEKNAWKTFATQYPREFKDFFDKYTNKFGDEAFDNGYLEKRLKDPFRRAEIKDQFINYLRELQAFSLKDLDNKEKQAKVSIRFGAENRDRTSIEQGYNTLNSVNEVKAILRNEALGINALEDNTKTLFRQDYLKDVENAQLEAEANRGEFLGTTELQLKKLSAIPFKIGGEFFKGVTSFITANSDWSKVVNEDIDYSTNVARLNRMSDALQQEVITYKDKSGNTYKYRDGNIYAVAKDGKEYYDSKIDNNTFKSNLNEVSKDKEWNITSVVATTAQVLTEIYVTNKVGLGLGDALSKPFGSYALKVANELGKENRWYETLRGTYKALKAPNNASPIGMALYSYAGNVERNNQLGYNGVESFFKAGFDSGMLYFANRFFPDARFFKEGDAVQKAAFELIKKGNKQEAFTLVKNFLTDASYYGKNITDDVLKENFEESVIEPLFQGITDVVASGISGDKKMWKDATAITNFIDTNPETLLITTATIGLAKGGQIINTKIKSDLSELNSLEARILQSSDPSILEALKYQVESGSITGFTATKAQREINAINTINKYKAQLPEDNTLSLQQAGEAIVNLQKLDKLKKEQANATSQSVKDDIQSQIDGVESEIKRIFEESKNNTLVDEQPQTEPQQQQEQEGVQGQTTETNVQPEQTTVEGNQNIPTNLEVNNNQNIEQNAIQEQTTNEGLLGTEQPSQKTGQEISMGLPEMVGRNQVAQETTQQGETQKVDNTKQEQLNIINKTNPAPNSYNVWVRNIDDIKTWDEILQLDDDAVGQFAWGDYSREDAEKALENGEITVYSSTPIKDGAFVSTSKIQAEEYAGGRNKKVYSKNIPLNEVAWINGDEGQYAKVNLQNETEIQQNQPTAEVNQQVESTPNEAIATSVQNQTQKEVTYKGKVYKYSSDENGEFITSPNGKRMTEYTEREIKKYDKKTKKYVKEKIRVANANFRKVKAQIFGEKTQNEINEEYKAREKEALSHLDDTNEKNIALLYFAKGGKVSYDSVKTELGEKVAKELTWAYLGKDGEDSIERVSERLAENANNPNISQTEIRNQLIEVLGSHGSVKEIKETIVQAYNKAIDPNFGYTDEDIAQLEYQSLPDNVKAIVDSVNAEATLTEEEKLQYEIQEYEKQLQSLSNEEQDQIYNAIYGEQRTKPQNESVQDSTTEPTQQEEVTEEEDVLKVLNDLKESNKNNIQNQSSNLQYNVITQGAFDKLIERLKKPFAKAFKNLNVTTDWKTFENAMRKLGIDKESIQQMVVAFHGSPHSFDKFSTKFIGTGEGAQAFGWGLYFTELESIARNYAKVLSRNIIKKPKITFDGQVLSNLTAYKIETYTDQKQFENKSKLIEKIQSFLDDAIAEKKRYVDNESLRKSMDKYIETYSNEIEALKKAKTYTYDKGRNIYKVSLHKGKTPKQYTWLVWDKQIPKKIQDIINDSGILNKEETLTVDEINRVYEQDGKWRISGVYGSNYKTREDALSVLRNILQKPIKSAKDFYGEGLYNEISKILGSDKEASLFLLDLGIDGIKYPAESISLGATSDTARGFNYVVFDEKAITIEEIIQFMYNGKGVIYGAKLPDGTIYINPDFVNANTAIHEFSHLWEQLMPTTWKKGVEIFKQTSVGKKIYNQLKNEGNYSNLTDNELWSEALNTHIGNYGEWKLSNSQTKMGELVSWLKGLFNKIGNYFGFKLNPETNLEQFTKSVVKDLLGGKPIVAESNNRNNGVQYSFYNESDFDADGNVKPEVLKQIEEERKSIIENSKSNGTYMKAPNGKDTNLNEQQWVDVRTKRFKDWFGDWENDAENASKVVDDNGEPMVVYHGTDSYFDEFSYEKINSKTGFGDFGRGFYLTASPIIAKYYTRKSEKPNIINGFVNSTKPFTININEETFSDETKQVYKKLRGLHSFERDVILENIDKPFGYKLINKELGDSRFTDILEINGYTSVNVNRTLNGETTYSAEIVAFNPNQIKSAENNVGTYSNKNNDIRFSIGQQNNIPFNNVKEVVKEIQNNGLESGLNLLQNTNWYKSQPESIKNSITTNNLVETLINSTEASLQDKEKSTPQDVKEKSKNRINNLKEDYKKFKKEIDQEPNAKVRLAEKIYWRRQAVNEIKQILKYKSLRKGVTDGDLVRLLNYADKILSARDINKAFDDFQSALDKALSRESKKERVNKEKYDKVYSEVEGYFNDGLSLDDILAKYDERNDQERAETAYYDIKGKQITPEQSMQMMEDINKREDEMLRPKTTAKEIIKKVKKFFGKKIVDRQTLPKKYLEKIGAMNTLNRLVNFGGAASAAKRAWDKAYNKIYFGLTEKEVTTLNNVIQNMRIISIANNREQRGLPAIKSTVANITIDINGKKISQKQMQTKDTAQAYLEGLRQKIGDKKFKEYEKRANAYFGEFKGLLDKLLEAGMIRQEAYDAMYSIDYQPRIFLQHLLDYENKIPQQEKNFRSKNNGLTKDLIRLLENGSEGVLLSNSQLLLASAIASRTQSIMMNEINKEFITKDFPKAKIRFEKIDPKNFKDEEEKRFYKYFKELDEKIIIPLTDTIEARNGYTKAYYFEDGVRKEFLMEDELHTLWNDKLKKVTPESLGYITGSNLFKALATGYNPAFILVNTPRDFLNILAFSPEYAGFAKPIEAGKLIYDTGKAWVNIYRNNRGKQNIIDKYFEYGGGMDFLNTQGMLTNTKGAKRVYEETARRLGKVLPEAMPKLSYDAFSKVLYYISFKFASNYSELGFRIANFTRAINNQLEAYNKANKTNYKTIDQLIDAENKVEANRGDEIAKNIYHYSVRSSRELLDFNQGGTLAKEAEAFVPYINAGIQGTRVAVRALKKDPANFVNSVIQLSVMSGSAMYGLGLMMMSIIRPDDEKDNIENYLDFRSTISPTVDQNYFVIPTAYDAIENKYTYIQVAKTQSMTPFFTVAQGIMDNFLKLQVGKEEIPFKDIMTDAWRAMANTVTDKGDRTIRNSWKAMSNNIDPTNLTTFFTTEGDLATKTREVFGKLASRLPLMKAAFTAWSGHDFYFDQPLSPDIDRVVSPLEGQNDKKIEKFYKDLALKTGYSAVRTKAFVESLITSPNTNLFVGFFYAGADIITTDVDFKDGMKDFLGYNKDKQRFVFNEIPAINRIMRESSDFTRTLNSMEKDVDKEELNNLLYEGGELLVNSTRISNKYLRPLREAKTDQEIAEIYNKAMDEAEKFAEENYTDDVFDQKTLLTKVSNKLQNFNIDGNAWDIKEESKGIKKAQALLIYGFYKDKALTDPQIQNSLKEAGVWSKETILYYEDRVRIETEKNK